MAAGPCSRGSTSCAPLRYITVADAYPGGGSLLQISGWPRVEKVLQAIEVVESLSTPPTSRPTTGGMFTAACPPVIGRNLTRKLATTPGCGGSG
jgi:hypothetical protein